MDSYSDLEAFLRLGILSNINNIKYKTLNVTIEVWCIAAILLGEYIFENTLPGG